MESSEKTYIELKLTKEEASKLRCMLMARVAATEESIRNDPCMRYFKYTDDPKGLAFRLHEFEIELACKLGNFSYERFLQEYSRFLQKG